MRGQLDGVARALKNEVECGEVLRLIASARGAMNSLMREVLEEHIRVHAFQRTKGKGDDTQGAEDLLAVVRTYLK